MNGGMYNQFETDPALEKGGIYINYYDNNDDDLFRVKIARAGGANKRFDKATNLAAKNNKRLLDPENTGSEKSKKIMREVYASTIILDWEVSKRDENGEVMKDEEGFTVWQQGIEGSDGSLLPYNQANVISTLVNLPGLYLDIAKEANRDAPFKKHVAEVEVKN